MNIVIRTNGTEQYTKKKVHPSTAARLEREGHFTHYNTKFGYIEGRYDFTYFESKGVKYKIEYFSGCFNPFLLQLKQ